MGAPAVTSRAQPARKPRTAPRPARRPATRPRATALPVVAVGRTAGAVGGLADSGLVHSLTRGRAWILLLGLLLGGIVAVNLYGLGLSAGGGKTAATIDELQRHNDVQRSRIAQRTSGERVEEAATALGLAVPAPDAVTYLESTDESAARAAERLANGRIALAPPAVEAPAEEAIVAEPPVSEAVPVEPVAADPAAAVDPATGLPIATTP
jgi:hypothetical protein